MGWDFVKSAKVEEEEEDNKWEKKFYLIFFKR